MERFTREAEIFCAHSGGEVVTKGRGISRLYGMIQSLQNSYGASEQIEVAGHTVTVAEESSQLASLFPSVPDTCELQSSCVQSERPFSETSARSFSLQRTCHALAAAPVTASEPRRRLLL